MGWNDLTKKVNYWLALRQARKEREAKGGGDKPLPHGDGMPLSVKWEKVAAWSREAYKVSSLHPLGNGKVLLGCYNNRERGTSRLQIVDGSGSRNEIWKGGEETIGQGWRGGGSWWLPVEKKNGDILTVPFPGGAAMASTKQGGQYACKIVEGHVAVGNRLFQVGDPETPRATFNRLGTIISGLVWLNGEEWIACDDEHGIQSERGWFIEAVCPELAVVNGVVTHTPCAPSPSLGAVVHQQRPPWVHARRHLRRVLPMAFPSSPFSTTRTSPDRRNASTRPFTAASSGQRHSMNQPLAPWMPCSSSAAIHSPSGHTSPERSMSASLQTSFTAAISTSFQGQQGSATSS